MSTGTIKKSLPQIITHVNNVLTNVNTWVNLSPNSNTNLITISFNRSGRMGSLMGIGAEILSSSTNVLFGTDGSTATFTADSGNNRFKITTNVSGITNVYLNVKEFLQ